MTAIELLGWTLVALAALLLLAGSALIHRKALPEWRWAMYCLALSCYFVASLIGFGMAFGTAQEAMSAALTSMPLAIATAVVGSR